MPDAQSAGGSYFPFFEADQLFIAQHSSAEGETGEMPLKMVLSEKEKHGEARSAEASMVRRTRSLAPRP